MDIDAAIERTTESELKPEGAKRETCQSSRPFHPQNLPRTLVRRRHSSAEGCLNSSKSLGGPSEGVKRRVSGRGARGGEGGESGLAVQHGDGRR